MSEPIASVTIAARLDLSGIDAQLRSLGTNQARKAGADIGTNIADGLKGQSSLITGIFQGIGQQITATLVSAFSSAINEARGLATEIYKVGAANEKAITTFTTLTGSAQEAKRVMGELSTFAASTPFDLPEVTEAGRKLTALGVEASKLVPTLTAVGNVAAGLDIPFSELADIYGKIKVQNRAYMEDINQLQGRGIPIIQEIAKMYGKSGDEIRKLIEQGRIGFPQIEEAFKRLTSEGGKFNGLMDQLAKTTSGKFTNLSDSIKRSFVSIFDEVKPAIDAALDAAAEVMSLIKVDLSDIGELAQDFADYLKENPEIIRGIAATLQEFAQGALQNAVDGARAIFDWFQKNPEVLGQMVSIVSNWVEGSLNIAKGFVSAITTDLGSGKTSLEAMAESMERFKNATVEAGQVWGQIISAMENAGNFLDSAGSWLTGGASDDFNAGGSGTTGANSATSQFRRNIGLHNSTFFNDIRNACAAAIRVGFREAGVEVGVTQSAWDTKQASLGPNMANSFFGSDVSTKVNIGDLKPGDLVAYDNNNDGIIDHVAAYIGNGRMSGTSSSRGMIVEHGLYDSGYGKPMYGARPKAYGSSSAAPDEDVLPNRSGSRSNQGSASSNWDRFLRYLAELESNGNINAKNPDSSARGAFQFLDTTRAEVLRKGGPDPYAGNYATQAAAAKFYIEYMKPGAAKAIAEGRFSDAFPMLNPLWTSLPGGAEAATTTRQKQAAQRYLQGNASPSSPSNTSNSRNSTPPPLLSNSDDSAQRERDKAKRDAESAAEEARRERERADRERFERVQQERRDRDARFTQETERGRVGKTGDALERFNLQRSGIEDLTKLTDQLEDLQAAQAIKQREGRTGGIDYAASIKNVQELIKGQKELNQAQSAHLENQQQSARIEAVRAQNAQQRDELQQQEGVLAALQDQLNVNNVLTPLQQERQRLGQELADIEEDIGQKIKNNTEQIAILQQKQAEKVAGRLDDDTDFASAINHLQSINLILGEQLVARQAITAEQQRAIDLEEEQAKVMQQWSIDRTWDRFNDIIKKSQENSSAAFQQTMQDMASASKVQMDLLDDVWEKANELNFQIVDTIGGSVRGLFSDMISGTKSLGQNLLDFLGNLASQLTNLALNSIFGSASNGTGLLGGIFDSIFGNKPSMNSLVPFSEVSSVLGLGIPGLAEGAIVTRPTLAVVGEGSSPEAVVPLDKAIVLQPSVG